MTTALLIMDVQQGIVERFASDESYLDGLATAITAARAAGVMVGYVTVAFRDFGQPQGQPGHVVYSRHTRTVLPPASRPRAQGA